MKLSIKVVNRMSTFFPLTFYSKSHKVATQANVRRARGMQMSIFWPSICMFYNWLITIETFDSVATLWDWQFSSILYVLSLNFDLWKYVLRFQFYGKRFITIVSHKSLQILNRVHRPCSGWIHADKLISIRFNDMHKALTFTWAVQAYVNVHKGFRMFANF